MKRTRIEKGITLIALIITIIILLILAVITIGSIKNSNIITYAQNAAKDYEVGKGKEQSILSQYETLIEEQEGNKKGTWEIQEDGETVINKKTNEKKKIGDAFTNEEVLQKLGIEKTEYKGTYTGTWTVIGVENKKLKLVSTTNLESSVTLGNEDPEVYVKDEDGKLTTELKSEIVDLNKDGNFELEKAIWSYNNAIDTIEAAVKTATKGITGARSITIEDIEDILNITDEQKRIENTSYGRTYRYYYEGDTETGKVYCRYLDWNETDTEAEDTTDEGWSGKNGGSYDIFISYDKVIDKTNANKNNVVKLKDNEYSYISAFADTKFTNSLGTGNYWIASHFVACTTSVASFYMPFVSSSGAIQRNSLFISTGSKYSHEHGIRAVVFI